MSLKDKNSVFWMKIGVKMLNSPAVMKFAEKSMAKKKIKQARREEKLKKSAKKKMLVNKDEIIRTNHTVRGVKYDIRELAKKVDALQKEQDDIKGRTGEKY